MRNWILQSFYKIITVVRPDMALVLNPKWMWRVAAGRWTKRLLHSVVVGGGRSTADHRAEPVREYPLDFHPVQVPGVLVDALHRVNPEREARGWNLPSKSNGSISSCWRCVLTQLGHYTIFEDRNNDCTQLLERLATGGQPEIANNFQLFENHFPILQTPKGNEIVIVKQMYFDTNCKNIRVTLSSSEDLRWPSCNVLVLSA